MRRVGVIPEIQSGHVEQIGGMRELIQSVIEVARDIGAVQRGE